MGAWGIGIFENDDAMDWVDDLLDAEDLSIFRDTFRDVIKAEYVAAPEASNALAAAEILAALKDEDSIDLPTDVDGWIREHRKIRLEKLIPLAVQAVERIMQHSELKELWEESDEFDNWLKIVNRLALRLKG